MTGVFGVGSNETRVLRPAKRAVARRSVPAPLLPAMPMGRFACCLLLWARPHPARGAKSGAFEPHETSDLSPPAESTLERPAGGAFR